MSQLSLRLLVCGWIAGLAGCGGDEESTPAMGPGDNAAMGAEQMPSAPAMAGAQEEPSAVAGAGDMSGTQGVSGAAPDESESTGMVTDAVEAGDGPNEGAPSVDGDAMGEDGAAGATAGDMESEADAEPPPDESEDTFEGNFSFFVTSIEIMRELSGSQDGFGGDLGGLEGADSICQQAAATQGAGGKTWRAFLSTSSEDAIDRIGEGPWYDRNGRLVAENLSGLTSGDRPMGDSAVANNLPNERGEPLNQDGTDDHDVLTGSNREGRLSAANATCEDWTSIETPAAMGGGGGRGGRGGSGPQLGHSWPARSGQSWVEAHRAPGCAPGVQLQQLGGGMGTNCVGCAGGYGGIYCFALEP